MIIALKTIRESKGIDANKLAEMTGLTKSMIWGYESGRRNPTPEQLCALADALDVSLDMLVRGKEKDRPAGRSREDIMNEYDSKSVEELHRLQAYLTAVIVDKEFQAHIRQDGQPNP